MNPATGTTTQGETVKEALANLQETTEVHLEELPPTLHGNARLKTIEVHPSVA